MTRKETKILDFKSYKVNVVCITCNNKYEIVTTLKKDFKIDVCSKCHPFYLGTQKFESKAGRMERFRKLEKKSAELKTKNEKTSPKVKKIENKVETKKVVSKKGN